jgi:hypothetical protein
MLSALSGDVSIGNDSGGGEENKRSFVPADSSDALALPLPNPNPNPNTAPRLAASHALSQ